MKRTCVGGSAMPMTLIAKFMDNYGVEVRHGWGMTISGIEIKVVDENGATRPRDGTAQGELMVRRVDRGALLQGRKNRAGGRLVSHGRHRHHRRTWHHAKPRPTKDVIKTGGEWISSIDLENAAIGHPTVAMADQVRQVVGARRCGHL